MAKRRSIRDRVKQDAKEQEQAGGKSQWLNLPEDAEFHEMTAGTNIFDIVPYEITTEDDPKGAPEDLWYERTVWVHYDIGAEKKAYACPLRTSKKPCPICVYRAKLIEDDSADEKTIEDLKPRERQIFNIIPDGEEDVKLYTTSAFLFGKKLRREVNESPDEWVGGFSDLEGGSTLQVRYIEKKLGKNKFLEADRIDFLERDDFGEEILDRTYDLNAILRVLPYDELEKILFELEEGTSPPAERPARRSSRRTRSEEPEPEEAPERPSRRRSSRRSEPEPEEPEEEETQEDPPARSRSRRSSSRQPASRRSSGRSRRKEPEEEPEEKPTRGRTRGRRTPPPPKEEPPTRGRGRKEEEEPAADGECPFGHKFGHDCNEFNDCDNCDEWEACVDEMDRIKAKK